MQAKVTTAELLLAYAAGLPPGEPLNVTHAAETIGRSRSSVKDVAHRLKAAGTLDRQLRGRGNQGRPKPATITIRRGIVANRGTLPKPPTRVGRVASIGRGSVYQTALIRGIPQRPLDMDEARRVVEEIRLAWLNRSRAAMHRAVYGSARAIS